MSRAALACLAVSAILAVSFQALVAQTSSAAAPSRDGVTAREALANARVQQRNARARAEQLEASAAQSREAAQKALQQAAALAARVQQAESSIVAAEAELAIVEEQRRALDARLAERSEPLARLTGALQTMASRPLVLSALQPGSLRDVVHTRVVLAGAVPVVRQRTASLRGELDRARALEEERMAALNARKAAEDRLDKRRRDMVAVAEKERILARRASGGANREAQRALELAEEARDLDGLVGRLESGAAQRQRLASLEGPIARPVDPQRSSSPRASGSNRNVKEPERFLLPVAGRVVEGFGENAASGARAAGIAIVPRAAAQVVAPAAGRVAFSGPYKGFGQIVIIEHEGKWTSLVTGLARTGVAVGQSVTAGSPLGVAQDARPRITYELRKDGKPLNPLDHLR